MDKNEVNNFIAEARRSGAGSHTKALEMKSQSFTSGDNGSVRGYFATFDHDHGDSYGDVIRKGAFLGTIERRKKTGHGFPLCFNHDLSCIIGRVTDIGEDAKGAYFAAEFFPTEKAQEVRSVVKTGVLWQCSFSYDTLDAGKVRAGDGSTVNELREIELYEISIVTIPANPRAILTDVKGDPSAELKDRKQKLLRYIDEVLGTDPETRLKKYREMEAQALKDIGRAEVEGRPDWKQRRLQALAAIRKEIRKLEKND